MILHREELAAARAYRGTQDFDGLTEGQLAHLRDRARVLQAWTRAHPLTHSAISLSVLTFLFVADYWVLLRLPPGLLGASPRTVGTVLLASVVTGFLHSYVMYSLAFFTMHTRLGRWAHVVASNLCRVGAAEPEYFSKHHIPHHLKFGTHDDGEFLNFVFPRRYWRSLLPFAFISNVSDFVTHRPPTYTTSRLLSAVIAYSYNGAYGYLLYRSFGAWFAVVVMVVMLPHAGFYLDRVRQFTEHNLMPLENENGARSLGFGFWGMLIGGGPWGSPCHLEHHLAFTLPWYGQLLLHRDVRKVLTPRQREQFLLRPVFGWPLLLWGILRELYAVTGRRRSGESQGLS